MTGPVKHSVVQELRLFRMPSGVLPLATAALAATIFIVDTITKVDLAFGTFYVGVVILTVQFWRSSRIALVAAGCVGLTILSYVISPHGETTFEGVVNTLIGIAVIVLTTVLIVKVKERSREDALREMQVDPAHANRVSTIGQRTASIAHEVSQPITAAVTNAQVGLAWLDRQPPDLDEVRLALDRIVKDGNRAGDIIGRIRGHIKKAPPRKGSFNLNSAVMEVIALAQSELGRNRVSVETRVASRLPAVEADRIEVQQVVLNLILNATEAMSSVGDGPRELSISAEQSEGDRVLVTVRDSGPGIGAEQLDRVFAPFYTTKSSGIGMGLSICRSIIEAHGGRLWVNANQPRGAVFQFTVPAARESGDEGKGKPDRPAPS